jgi:hypothetical protein
MKKLLIPAFAAAIALGFTVPAHAERDVMIMAQEVPMTGPAPATTSPVTIEIKMDPATMAAMHGYMHDGALSLTCQAYNLSFMMCHGK